MKVNQRIAAKIDRLFEPVGSYKFNAGTEYSVEVSNESTNGHVIADAVQVIQP